MNFFEEAIKNQIIIGKLVWGITSSNIIIGNLLNKEVISTIKKGKIHGKRVSYTGSGKVITREKFKQGKGIYRTYHTNDRIKSFGMIDGEIKEGVWKYFDRRGILKAEEFWSLEVPNQIEWEKFYRGGKIESELYYKMGILNKEVYYDENGKVLKTD